LLLLWTLYCGFFLPLDPHIQAAGVEHQRLSGLLIPAEIGLQRYGHIPTWNSYMGLGEPLINNPFNYLFNPFASIPVLWLGGIQGTKLALVIGLLIAGINTWALMRVLGVGAVARVTTGALYMMSGGIAAKFMPGHFQLGLSLIWPPLVFAALWWTLRSSDRRAPALMALAFALMFFAGNIYYTLHTLVASVVIVGFHLVDREAGWRIRFDRLRRVMIGGVFAFGLAALQFIPVWMIRDYILHDGNPDLFGRYSMAQATLNFIFPWGLWGSQGLTLLNMIESVDYAYIGPAVFLLIGAAVIALLAAPQLRRRFRTSSVVIALLLALLFTAWGAGETSVIQWLYANVSLLAQFRWVGRALSIAALWWIVLAGLSVDVLWQASRDALATNPAFDLYDRKRLLRALLIAVIVWIVFTIYGTRSDETRAALVLYSEPLYNFFNINRYRTFPQSAEGLWFLLLFAALLDTLWLVLESVSPPRWRVPMFKRFGVDRRAYGTRLLRLGVLLLVLVTIADVMSVNSRLFYFNERLHDFNILHEYAQNADETDPLPAIYEPFSPFMFGSYYNQTRNWELNEGWRPGPVPGVVEVGEIVDAPRWAIAWNPMGDQRDNAFVEAGGYELRYCVSLSEAQIETLDDCNYESNNIVAGLYELPRALPYAFVAPLSTLLGDGTQLQRDIVLPVAHVNHQQDTITIEAETPTIDLNEFVQQGGQLEAQNYHLVVQETNFPGWNVFIDGVPVATTGIGRFIGIPMLAGAHEYTLRYDPPGFALGVVIFIVTLLAMGFYLKRK